MSLRGWQWEEGRATAYLRAPAELATDLLHAYMGNPAWTRETWPHLAKLVRDHVNDDSRTRHGDSSDDGSGPGRSRSGRWQWRWRWPWRR